MSTWIETADGCWPDYEESSEMHSYPKPDWARLREMYKGSKLYYNNGTLTIRS